MHNAIWLLCINFMAVLCHNIINAENNDRSVRYTVTDLGTLPGYKAIRPLAINNFGHIVGTADDRVLDNGVSYRSQRAFLYKKGKIYDLGTLGGVNSGATNINDNDQIVGGSGTKSGYHIFLYKGNQMVDIGTLNGGEDTATSINNKGQIVGIAEILNPTDNKSENRAFLWSNNKITNIGTLGGRWSEANAINTRGQIVGWSYIKNGDIHAFLWQKGQMTDLGTLQDGTFSVALAINEDGITVGKSDTALGKDQSHAFRFEKGKMIDLGTFGGRSSVANSINKKGEIVGSIELADSPYHNIAFIWHNGKIVDLNKLISLRSGWILEEAVAINDHGQIIGHGTHNGRKSAFLLTPVPEEVKQF